MLGTTQHHLQDLTNLSAGTYTVTVTDVAAAAATTVTTSRPVFSGASQVNVFVRDHGIIDLTVTGGTPPYTYASNDAGATTTQDVSALPSGTYTVVVTDNNGCTESLTTTISEPTAISLSTTQTSIGCNGSSTGRPYCQRWCGTVYVQLERSKHDYHRTNGLSAGAYGNGNR